MLWAYVKAKEARNECKRNRESARMWLENYYYVWKKHVEPFLNLGKWYACTAHIKMHTITLRGLSLNSAREKNIHQYAWIFIFLLLLLLLPMIGWFEHLPRSRIAPIFISIVSQNPEKWEIVNSLTYHHNWFDSPAVREPRWTMEEWTAKKRIRWNKSDQPEKLATNTDYFYHLKVKRTYVVRLLVKQTLIFCVPSELIWFVSLLPWATNLT